MTVVSQHPDRMVSRMKGASPQQVIMDEAALAETSVQQGRPTFNISVVADDGTVLLRMFERGGRLAVEGDESRWEEGARRFVYQMLQWSGQFPITWKDEARKAADSP